MDIAGASISGPRPYNEDSYYYFDFSQSSTTKTFTNGITAFVMVSDGMGGHEGGDVASALACQAAEDYMASLLSMDGDYIELDVPLALTEIVAASNRAIAEYSQANEIVNMGATFVGAFIGINKAWIGHVGDSRAYKIRRGKMAQLTQDHSAVGKMLSDGLLTEEQAQNHPRRNVIERALGFTNDDPEINEVYFGRGDALILCSDGLSSVLSANDMSRSLLLAKSVDDAADDLLKLAEKKATDDNATVVVAARNWTSMQAQSPKPSLFARPVGQSGWGGIFSNTKNIIIAIFALCLLAIIVGLFVFSGGLSPGGGSANPATAESAAGEPTVQAE